MCATAIASVFVLHTARSGMLEALSDSPAVRDTLLQTSRQTLGIEQRTALNAGDIPLPSTFGSEIRELISEFGVARKAMTRYPIGKGTARPARVGTRPAFVSIAMNALMTERSPTLTYASLESHKIGGLVRLPREIDEQSMVDVGRFLAQYGAIEFARAEDTWAFLADGTAPYEQVKGVVQVATEGAKTVTLGATKTKPSDATLDDFRAIRGLVNKACLSARLGAYYLDSTWEIRLRAFNTAADPHAFVRLADGTALLDGYPVIWTDVMTPYGTAAAAGKPLAVFGALKFWWMGEHRAPRIDTSEHVFFANDQLAVRFAEEIDYDYMAGDAAAALITAAA